MVTILGTPAKDWSVFSKHTMQYVDTVHRVHKCGGGNITHQEWDNWDSTV